MITDHLWPWDLDEVFVGWVVLPWSTRWVRGECLSIGVRIKMAATREVRRERMYEMIRMLYADGDRGANERLARAHTLKTRRFKREVREEKDVREGGPIAWQYLTPRVQKLYEKGEIGKEQRRAAIDFVYFYRIGWLMTAPGTNMIRGEAVDSGGYRPRTPWTGKTVPIHKLLSVEYRVLESALIFEVSFKDLPASIGDSRITRHRTGRAAFISALTTLHRLFQSLLTT